MSEAIIGTDSVVGFANGYQNGSGHLLATTIDRADHTRSIVHNSRFEAEQLRDAIADTSLAVEKVGAAGQVTAEKLGAANQLTAEKIGAATQIAAERLSTATQLAAERINAASTLAAYQNFAALQLQAAQNHAAAMAASAQCCCDTKELIHLDGQKTRDLVNAIERDRQACALVDAKQALLLAQLRGNGGNGNGHS
jgi:hypothetical protein